MASLPEHFETNGLTLNPATIFSFVSFPRVRIQPTPSMYLCTLVVLLVSYLQMGRVN